MPMWSDQPDSHFFDQEADDRQERRAARRAQREREAAALRRRRLTASVTGLAVIAAAGVIMLRPAGDDGAPQVAGAASVAAPAAEPTLSDAASGSPAASVKPSTSSAKKAATNKTQKSTAAAEATIDTDELPVLSEGDYGDVIAVAQRALDVEPTGYFGPKTLAAVMEYQESVGLPATGQVAAFTWSTLGAETVEQATQASATADGYVNAEPAQIQETPAAQQPRKAAARSQRADADPPVLEETDSGESVAVIQRALGVKPATGYFGPMTAKAVRQFQADNGIPTTGVIASYTWGALGASLRADAAAAHAAYGTVFGPGVKDGGDNGNGGGNGGGNGNGNGNGNGGGAGGNGDLYCPVANFSYGDGLGAPRPGGRTHAGLDLMGSRGEPIYAIDSGTVTRSGYQSNGAMILDITGSGGMYFYGHFDKILVGYGESVKAGQLIGYMGDTGSPGAVHLHLEVRPNGWSGGYEDPVPLIRSLCG